MSRPRLHSMDIQERPGDGVRSMNHVKNPPPSLFQELRRIWTIDGPAFGVKSFCELRDQ